MRSCGNNWVMVDWFMWDSPGGMDKGMHTFNVNRWIGCLEQVNEWSSWEWGLWDVAEGLRLLWEGRGGGGGLCFCFVCAFLAPRGCLLIAIKKAGSWREMQTAHTSSQHDSISRSLTLPSLYSCLREALCVYIYIYIFIATKLMQWIYFVLNKCYNIKLK